MLQSADLRGRSLSTFFGLASLAVVGAALASEMANSKNNWPILHVRMTAMHRPSTAALGAIVATERESEWSKSQ
jgi:hypothetical protein